MEIEHLDLPFLAETLTMMELSKLGIYSVRLTSQFDFDLYCVNDARIEVKSSRIVKSGKWNFHNTKKKYYREDGVRKVKQTERDRKCDFFVLVGFYTEYEPHFYIVPKKIIGTQMRINVKPNDRQDILWRFFGKWDQISEFTRRVLS